MIETKVAKRYAKSLIDLSNETGVLDTVANDMKLFLMLNLLGLVLFLPPHHSLAQEKISSFLILCSMEEKY